MYVAFGVMLSMDMLLVGVRQVFTERLRPDSYNMAVGKGSRLTFPLAAAVQATAEFGTPAFETIAVGTKTAMLHFGVEAASVVALGPASTRLPLWIGDGADRCTFPAVV